MAKKIFSIFLIVYLFIDATSVHGKEISAVTDSLLKVIPTLKDSAKLEAYVNLIYSVYSNPDLGLKYCKLYEKEAERQGNIRDQSYARAKKIEFFGLNLKLDSISKPIKEFEEFCDKYHYYRHYFNTEFIVLNLYIHKSHYTLALNHAKKMYEKAITLNSIKGIIYALQAIARVYTVVGNYKEAIRIDKEIIQILKENKSKGNVLQYINTYLQLSSILADCGNDYTSLINYTDTLDTYINKRAEACPDLDLSEYSFYTFCFKAMGYSNLDKQSKAFEFLQKARDTFSDKWGAISLHNFLFMQCSYYLNFGDYTRALEYCNELLKMSSDGQLSQIENTYLLSKARILAGVDNYKEAVNTYIRIKEITDSLKVEQYANQVSELETIYKLNKTEYETGEARIETGKFRIWIIGLIIICILLAVIVYLTYHNRNQLRKKNLALFNRIKELNSLEVLHEEKKTVLLHPKSEKDLLYVRLIKLMKEEKLFIDSNLTRKVLAEKLNTNEIYLFKTLKEHQGKNVSEYITDLRLNHARKLLTMPDNDYTIEVIAIESGFRSRSTFYRVFKEKYGLTPLEFRKLALERTL